MTITVGDRLPEATFTIFTADGPTPWSRPQAFITNTSLTETQAIRSTPLAFSSLACCT